MTNLFTGRRGISDNFWLSLNLRLCLYRLDFDLRLCLYWFWLLFGDNWLRFLLRGDWLWFLLGSNWFWLLFDDLYRFDLF